MFSSELGNFDKKAGSASGKHLRLDAQVPLKYTHTLTVAHTDVTLSWEQKEQKVQSEGDTFQKSVPVIRDMDM